MSDLELLERFEEDYLEDIILIKDEPIQKRALSFQGAKNFRDLGGYETMDGRAVRRGILYRSGGLHKLSNKDLEQLSTLYLDKVIDFRARHEMEREPDRLPRELTGRRVEIPILDASTRVWYASREEMIRNLKKDDASKFMIQTYVELATKFRPEMRKFMEEVFSANGNPILFHCAAGKDRTGFAAAVILRMLGVPQGTVMDDYMLTNRYLIAAYKWSLAFGQLVRGRKFIGGVKAFMEARPEYLMAAFDAIDREWGTFENYVRDGLGLPKSDMEHLKRLYLE